MKYLLESHGPGQMEELTQTRKEHSEQPYFPADSRRRDLRDQFLPLVHGSAGTASVPSREVLGSGFSPVAVRSYFLRV